MSTLFTWSLAASHRQYVLLSSQYLHLIPNPHLQPYLPHNRAPPTPSVPWLFGIASTTSSLQLDITSVISSQLLSCGGRRWFPHRRSNRQRVFAEQQRDREEGWERWESAFEGDDLAGLTQQWVNLGGREVIEQEVRALWASRIGRIWKDGEEGETVTIEFEWV